MAQSIKGSVAGLYAACQSIYASSLDSSGSPVLVSYGAPGNYQPNVIVAVGMDVRQPVTRPTGGTNRSRDKHAEIDVVISVFVPGSETQQQVASEQCDDLTELLEAYFRTSGNETLGGGCRDSWVSNIAGPTPDIAYDQASNSPIGRLAASVVTVSALIRQ